MKYVAFLRAIMPQMHPSQKTENLVKVFTGAGLNNVKAYFASGNIMFESSGEDKLALETKIEKALLAGTGIETPTIVRSFKDLENFVKEDPFNGVTTTSTIKPHITFLKDISKKSEVAYVVDISKTTTPKIMRDLEKEYGKKVTTRTWNTVLKVYNLMSN